jgi:hypothetical protein
MTEAVMTVLALLMWLIEVSSYMKVFEAREPHSLTLMLKLQKFRDMPVLESLKALSYALRSGTQEIKFILQQ